ncbi:hypothetical protein M422DRAFT_253962 [Sphaerobolus stellatus SS14]|uniref:Uncharacterized protein n=1 Tax=Sphaerobolus stellatus (strain SS14) TaxID=990650 RepID=A0A0C9VVZ3_SPHS4|nr:hypothetical protein M422DRAFT_253962 [Sphaerobolus stellatus SS14]
MFKASLTVEEKEELLYGLMADLDMSESTGAEPSGEEEVVSEWEDFAKRDDRDQGCQMEVDPRETRRLRQAQATRDDRTSSHTPERFRTLSFGSRLL